MQNRYSHESRFFTGSIKHIRCNDNSHKKKYYEMNFLGIDGFTFHCSLKCFKIQIENLTTFYPILSCTMLCCIRTHPFTSTHLSHHDIRYFHVDAGNTFYKNDTVSNYCTICIIFCRFLDNGL